MENRRSNTKHSTTHELPNQQHQTINCFPDINYLLTLDGLLKCLAITLNFLCFLCISLGGFFLGIGFSTFISITGFTASLIFLLLYIFHFDDNFNNIPWITTEMIFCFIWAIFHFISGNILGFAAATQQHATFGWAIASFFSFSTMCVYGLDSYMKLKNWKRDDELGETV